MQIQVKLQKTVKTTHLEGKEQETRYREYVLSGYKPRDQVRLMFLGLKLQ